MDNVFKEKEVFSLKLFLLNKAWEIIEGIYLGLQGAYF
jgi:hypothetical protein